MFITKVNEIIVMIQDKINEREPFISDYYVIALFDLREFFIQITKYFDALIKLETAHIIEFFKEEDEYYWYINNLKRKHKDAYGELKGALKNVELTLSDLRSDGYPYANLFPGDINDQKQVVEFAYLMLGEYLRFAENVRFEVEK